MTIIRLKCPACGHGLQVKEIHAGKQGRCPKCSQVIQIPLPPAEDKEVSPPDGQMRLKERPPDGPKPEAQPPAWDQPDLSGPTAQVPKGLRRHPPFMDILLYPTSMPGLLNLLIFWGFVVLDVVLNPGLQLRGILNLFLMGLFTAYLTYYLSDCIRDSADGGTRAPDNLTSMPHFEDALHQVMDVVATVVTLALPAGLYALIRWRIDPVFWGLLGCGAFCLPMALLSAILFNSVSGLNPKYWMISIGRVFLPYLGLTAVLVLITAAMNGLQIWMAGSVIGFIAVTFSTLYLAMISAHILGRFYFRFEKRIRWGI